MQAIRLSLRYGGGDLHWFERLSHDDQVLLMSYLEATATQAKPRTGEDALRAHAAKLGRLGRL